MDDRAVLWLVIPALVALVFFGRLASDFAESRRRRTAFGGVPVIPIQDAANANGVVQCVGHLIVRDALVLAPLRGQEAAFARIRVMGKRSAHASAPTEKVLVEERWASVSLVDATGTIQLDIETAQVEFDPDRDSPRQFTTNLVGPPRETLAVWMRERELETRVGSHGARFDHLELAEWILEAGDEVAVVGVVKPHDGPYRDAPVLRVAKVHLLRAKSR